MSLSDSTIPDVPIYQVGDPLPSAVLGSRTSISSAARDQIERLSRPDRLRFLWQQCLAWAAIVVAIVLAEHAQNTWITILVILFIPTRQNILALLIHEQCHRLAFRSKAGDLWCNLTIAYPMLVTLEGYRRVHLAHHQNYFTERDPDYRRKQGREWTFPQRAARLMLSFLQDLSGLSLWKTIKGKGMGDAAAGKNSNRFGRWIRILFYVALAAVLTSTQTWRLYLLYWLLPLATVMQVIVRWGAICEHKYNLIQPGMSESTPIIEPRSWERLLLPNLNFTLHVYHHWFPRVPFAKLPKVHAIFRQEGLVDEENVFHGYGDYLCYLLGRGRWRHASAMQPRDRSLTRSRQQVGV